MLNNEYFLWGASTHGAFIIDKMKNDLAFKAVIDSDPAKQGTVFHGLPVISYDEAKKEMPGVKVVIARVQPRPIHKILMDDGYLHNHDFFTLFQFVPRYYHEKGKMVAFLLGLSTTTDCTYSCTGCQNYVNLGSTRDYYDFNMIKNDVDAMFCHLDYIVHICLNVGESMLNPKTSVEICSYIHANYSDRYYRLSVITNGSIIPDDETLISFAKSETILSISTYASSESTAKILVQKCEELDVPFVINTTSSIENWVEVGDPRILQDDKEEKIGKWGCWTGGIALHNGHLYMCALQAWAEQVMNIGSIHPGDAFDLNKPKTNETNKDLYRVISSQPASGYISHCMRCNGLMTPLITD